MSRVAIVGGGLAGLLAAMRLQQRGHEVELFEATPALGGMITSVSVGDAVVDAGAEGFAVRGGTARALCDELGIEVAAPQGTSQFWWRDGSYPMAAGILGIPSSLDDPALAALTADELAIAAAEPQLDPAVGADAQTVGELVRARLGEAVVNRLVAPVTRGIYSLEPDRMLISEYAPQLLPMLAETGSLLRAVARLRGRGSAALEQPVGGMFQLTKVLSERVAAAGVVIHTDARVAALERDGQVFRIRTASGVEAVADHVVLAAPAHAAAELLAGLGAEFPIPPRRTLRAAILSVANDEFDAHPVGSGVLVADPDADRDAARALTHYSAKWQWAPRHVFRLTYPTHILPTSADALRDLNRLTGVTVTADQVTGFAAVSWESVPTPITPELRSQIHASADAVGVQVIGAWVDGNGVAPVLAGVARLLEHEWFSASATDSQRSNPVSATPSGSNS